jgi:hypothetical protein
MEGRPMTHTMAASFRAAAPAAVTRERLGLLGELPGTWVGNGFNIISLPVHPHTSGSPFRVKVNATRETLSFSTIGGPIPNRGFVENDIFFLGLHYLQIVSDAATNAGMHLEPGLWLNMPLEGAAPSDDPLKRLLVRQATIPHGDSLLALSTNLLDVPGGPKIAVENSLPIRFSSTVALPKTDPYVVKPFADAAKAMATIPGIQAAALFDPNLVLTDAIKGQTISDTKVIIISTKGVENSGIVNAPFVVKNANAASLDAIFWIETVTQPGSDPILQLQYTQRVILDFDQVHWPHISVATLVKQ